MNGWMDEQTCKQIQGLYNCMYKWSIVKMVFWLEITEKRELRGAQRAKERLLGTQKDG